MSASASARLTRRPPAGPAHLDEVRALGVVHLDPAVEPPGELGMHEELQLAVPGPPGEPAGDEQRLPLERAPARSSSIIVAAIAVRRGSFGDPGIGSAGGSTTTVARPPRGTSASSGCPASGKRSASRTAAAMSAIGSTGGGGASTIASSPASTTASREPYGSGTRVKPA